ncbi:transcription factor SRM1-like [Salvia divinorum]|uniref:Transcription factor SRM1-like n=1 Tax=Salvia divinorum TaxID=28513 RepID=A0ABD1H6V5_SALDI
MANTGDSVAELSSWTLEEDKRFEDCLADSVGRWEEIATRLGTISAAEAERRYALLLKDLAAMEAGEIELQAHLGCSKSVKRQTRKTIPWTEDEHGARNNITLLLFLKRLKTIGKGNWKKISRIEGLNRNPTQVASHAQKHFKRQEENQRKKRRRIFDTSI